MEKLASNIEKTAAWLGTGSINLFGMPFAGKDTQGAKLAEIFGASLMGGGDIFRSNPIPHVIEAMNQGDMAPTDAFIDIVLPYLERPEFAGRPIILSSLGRSHGEEAGVLEATTKSNHPLKAVVFLTISEAEQRARWQAARDTSERGERGDDAEHLLEVRLNVFRERTLPVVDTYRRMGLLVEVDGEGSVEEVTARILEALAVFQGRPPLHDMPSRV